MILNNVNLSKAQTTKKKHIVVDVPDFGVATGSGEDAQIMVTEMTVAGYLRNSTLQRSIFEMQNIDDTRRTGLLMCAGLLSTMVCPDTGEFLFKEDDLDSFHSIIDRISLDSLLSAHGQLNPTREFKTLDTKKKSS